MARRSKSEKSAQKAANRTPATAKRSIESNAARSNSSVASLRRKLESQRLELEETRQQQAASSEVLRIISASAGALTPVFKAIVESAVDLCRARFGAVFRMDGDLLHLVADHNFGPEIEGRAEAQRLREVALLGDDFRRQQGL